MRLVCIADTHGLHPRVSVPDGDVLIHAGDLSMGGGPEEIHAAARFLKSLSHPHKIVIAGNHDWLFQRDPERARGLLAEAGCVYLEDAGTEVAGIRVYGSPWQPWFLSWAFNLERGEELREKWDLIPDGVDILVTHGPPHGILDDTPRGERVGCEELLGALRRVRPRYHVFGHIHMSYGVIKEGDTTFVNASMCDESYGPVNEPVVLDL